MYQNKLHTNRTKLLSYDYDIPWRSTLPPQWAERLRGHRLTGIQNIEVEQRFSDPVPPMGCHR